MGKINDHSGKIFGWWTVLHKSSKKSKSKVILWKCKCICGIEKDVFANVLTTGKSSSCGCKNLELTLKRGKKGSYWCKHNLASHPLYRVHQAMLNRCNNEKQISYKFYGAKGIRVCDEWSNFESFFNWAIKTGYREGLTIERINPSKNYFPENCEWVTREENSSRIYRNMFIDKSFNGWKCIRKIPFSPKALFKCEKCKRRKLATLFYVTSGKAVPCKCL